MLYSRRGSARCWLVTRLLRASGYDFVVVDTTTDRAVLDELSGLVHHQVTAPYVMVDHRPVGGLEILRALVRTGGLDRLARGAL